MKFVYFGYDFMLPSVHRLIADGHELIGVFSFDCDNVFNFNRNTLDLAQDLDIPFTTKRPMPVDIEAFIDQDVDIFLSAGYPYKIPPIDEDRAYGINLHPSLLPAGRGLMPTPTIIMHNLHVAGITIHKLSEKFDEGDILYQKAIELTSNDDVETYSGRIALICPDVLAYLFPKIESLWINAKAQNISEASRYPIPDNNMRTLNWNNTVEALLKISKAFGRFGALAELEDRLYAVYTMNGWKQDHDLKPGTIALVMSREIIIAVQDGYIILKDMQELQG